MILRSMEVEGFRCFDRLLAIHDFAPGLNVLSGPNGAGKSTLLRALRHVLVDAHSLTGAVVKQAMAPWGRALSPRIRVCIAHGGVEWRVEKRFLNGASSRLEQLENGVFRPLAEGKEADQRVREMLLADAAAKGLASEGHWGLLQVLWTPQGPPVLAGWSAGVRATLQEAFGAALRSRSADQIASLIDRRYEEYFTPTGQVKKASPVIPLQQESARLQGEWRKIGDQWKSAGIGREALGRLRERIANQTARHAVQLPELERARQWQRDFSDATAAELRVRRDFEQLEARLSQWREDVAKQQVLEKQAQEALARLALGEKELVAALSQKTELEGRERELESLQQRGVDAKSWPDLAQFRALAAVRQLLRAQVGAISAPGAKAMRQLRELQQQLEIKRAGLSAASLKLILEAEAPITIETGGATHAIEPGQPLELADARQIEIRLPGIARITAASANAQAASLAREVDELARQLQSLSGGEPIGALEERFAAREKLERQLETKEAEARALDSREAELRDLAARRPEWEIQPPDITVLRDAWKSCKDDLDQKRKLFDLPALSSAAAAIRATLEERNRQLGDLAARLAQHAAVGSLDSLESQRNQTQIDLGIARMRLTTLQAAVPADVAALEQTFRILETALAADREACARLEGELAVLEAQNIYTRLSETEELLAETNANLDRQNRRAGAIQLLKTTLASAQLNLSAALPDQIAEHATRNWREIAGPQAHPIQIGDAWIPAGLRVPNATAALDELSGGEAEQVAFATRLALATQLAQTSRQLAVFDDAFLATDPARAERILDLLARAAESLQIIVLTCHPARYAPLPGVRHFDLEKMKG